jgi:ubiquinone/menaquinone biosynthesis C-methylase UbiE
MEILKSTKDTWNANLYDNQHFFVSKYGESVLELLAPQKGERILDLGCGTGDLAKKLSDTGVDVTGADKSENMIMKAQNKYPDIHFIVQDATRLDYHEEFDAVFSNATLHWVKQPKQALACIYQSLKKGGRFVAEFGGKGNVQTISEGIITEISRAGYDFEDKHFPWFFPTIGEYSVLMEEAGFRVVYAQHFDRPTVLNGDHGVNNWIEMFGSDMFEGIPNEKRADIIAKAEKAIKNKLYKDGNWIADYKRIRVIGIKE